MGNKNLKSTLLPVYGDNSIKKTKTIKGTAGDDPNIKSTSANENIYLYSGNDTVTFSKTHGTDTVYASSDSTNLVFDANLSEIQVSRSGNNVLIKTKNAKNKTETVTLKNYLRSSAQATIVGNDSSKDILECLNGKQYTLGNSKSTKALTINGTRLDNEIFNGGKGNDKINVYGGEGNIITGGKGNDTINLGSSSDNIIKIKRGDGKDKIIFDNNVNSNKVATIYGIDADDIRYYKSENDLTIRFYHKKLSKNKKATYEYVTIKNAFDSEGDLSEKLYISIDNGQTEDKISDVMYLDITTEENKNNNISGTKYADRIYCGNKDNIITDMQGDNVIVTSPKGKSEITTGLGDDFFYIKSLNTITTINDSGGKNEIIIESNDNFNDVYTFFDVASLTYEGEPSSYIAIVNGNNLSTLTFNSFNNDNLKGVKIRNFHNNFDVALINSNGEVSDTIKGSDLLSHFVKENIRKFLDNYTTGGYNGTAYQFLNDSSVSDANKKALLELYKSVSLYNGEGLAIGENTSGNHNAKSITLGNDTSDTITLKGKFQDTTIVNNGKYDTKGGVIAGKPQEPITVCDDKIVIDNYSLTDDSILIGSYNYAYDNENHKIQTSYSLYTDLNLVAFDKDNKNNYTDYHKLDIENVSGKLNGIWLTARSCSYRLYLQDKDRTYQVESHISDIATEHYTEDNFIDFVANRDNSNKMLFVRGLDNYLRLAETYNIVNIYSDCSSSILYSGGWAKIISENPNSRDYYEIWNFDKNSQVIINDAGSMIGEDTDDVLFVDSDTSDFRLFFNVNKDGGNVSLRDSQIYSDDTHTVYSLQNYDDNDLFIIHKDNMNAKNISLQKTFESNTIHSSRTGDAINNSILGYYNADLSIDKGITIENMLSDDGKIELFQSSSESNSQYLSLDYWISAVKEGVSSWLGNHSQYQDAMDVLENGSKADINSLLAVYSNTEYTGAPV